MSPADELRAAAARLEELAASATPGPWTADHELITAPSGTGSGPPTLITEVVGSSFEGGGVAREADSAWIAAMSPALAAPLVDLFRTRARGAEAFEDTLAGGDEFTPEQVRETSEKNLRLELALARVINGTTS